MCYRRTVTHSDRFRRNRMEANMVDDFANRGPQDRRRINLSEDYEVAYWTRKWGISREELVKAVWKAGPMSAAVAKLLGKEV